VARFCGGETIGVYYHTSKQRAVTPKQSHRFKIFAKFQYVSHHVKYSNLIVNCLHHKEKGGASQTYELI
jgi:hypothetical protein